MQSDRYFGAGCRCGNNAHASSKVLKHLRAQYAARILGHVEHG